MTQDGDLFVPRTQKSVVGFFEVGVFFLLDGRPVGREECLCSVELVCSVVSLDTQYVQWCL